MPIGYDPRFGGVPSLQSSLGIQSNVSNLLNTAIPGFGGLTGGASKYVSNLLNGEVSPEARDAIRDENAAWGITNGIPGSGLMGNRGLRNLGLTVQGNQQKGLEDLLSLLGGYSGRAVLNPDQVMEQDNAREQYSSAPNPASANKHLQSLFNQYSGGGANSWNNNRTSTTFTPAFLTGRG